MTPEDAKCASTLILVMSLAATFLVISQGREGRPSTLILVMSLAATFLVISQGREGRQSSTASLKLERRQKDYQRETKRISKGDEKTQKKEEKKSFHLTRDLPGEGG